MMVLTRSTFRVPRADEPQFKVDGSWREKSSVQKGEGCRILSDNPEKGGPTGNFAFAKNKIQTFQERKQDEPIPMKRV